jgi:carboxyl-terminal processing protease
MHGGALLRAYNIAYPETVQITTSDAIMRPREQPAFGGRLILLIDRRCSCACEDFIMPFKVTKRAQLVGETSAGAFSFTNSTQFENGMRLNVSSVRHTFPDGSKFEGVGISPDIEIQTTAQALKSGKDVVLERALAIANQK